jgi:2-oxoglutarate ferredoxin oxidoreductase subunit gamma
VGFFTAVTHLLDPAAVRKAVADSVPANFRDLNLQAFEKGYDYGAYSLKDSRASQELEHVAYAEE